MSRGTVFMRDWETRALAQREAIHVTARCGFCDWTLEGTVANTRQAHHQHRLEQHPELQPKPRRKRHRKYGQLPGMKNLDDNIAKARQQGAAGWAGPE